ncbi:MAG: hypothetical protein Q4Q62_01475 [Thermoplasmata archaeon]|nr:hypothetical protein [Thermoplasmata archaeon]
MSGRTPKHLDRLIWTGPRMSDIQDCEIGLFAGSITLYGDNDSDDRNCILFHNPWFLEGDGHGVKYLNYEESRKALSDDEAVVSAPRSRSSEYVRDPHASEGLAFNKRIPWQYEAKELCQDYHRSNHEFCCIEGSRTFNRAFVKSFYNLMPDDRSPGPDGEVRFERGCRINHNLVTVSQDLFTLCEQIKIIGAAYACRELGRRGRELTRKSDCSCNGMRDIGRAASKVFCEGKVDYSNSLWFMSYNPNFVARRGDEDQYLALVKLIETIHGMNPPEKESGAGAEKSRQLIDDAEIRKVISNIKAKWDKAWAEGGFSDRALVEKLCEDVRKTGSENFAILSTGDEMLLDPFITYCYLVIMCYGPSVFRFGRYGVPDLEDVFRDSVRKHSDGHAFSRDEEILLYLHCINEGRNPRVLVRGSPEDEAWIASQEILRHTLCLNEEGLMKDLNSKKGFRDLCKEHEIPTTEAITIEASGADCNIDLFRGLIKDGAKYVVQEPNSSGGFGTYLFEDPMAEKADNEARDGAARLQKKKEDENRDIRRYLEGNPADTLLISRYRDPNVSVNLHAIITDDDVFLSPCSIQIITITDRRLIYSGADFDAFRRFEDDNPSKVKEIYEHARWLCGILGKRNYRGVIGFDIIVSDRVEFVEANNRFQASTILLNKALAEYGLRKDTDSLNLEVRPRLMYRYDDRTVSKGPRLQSIQMQNLLAFYGKPDKVYASPAGAGRPVFKKGLKTIGLRDEARIRDMVASLPKTLYGNDPNTNRENWGNILRSELRTIPVPYSFYIYHRHHEDKGTEGSSEGSESEEHRIFHDVHMFKRVGEKMRKQDGEKQEALEGAKGKILESVDGLILPLVADGRYLGIISDYLLPLKTHIAKLFADEEEKRNNIIGQLDEWLLEELTALRDLRYDQGADKDMFIHGVLRRLKSRLLILQNSSNLGNPGMEAKRAFDLIASSIGLTEEVYKEVSSRSDGARAFASWSPGESEERRMQRLCTELIDARRLVSGYMEKPPEAKITDSPETKDGKSKPDPSVSDEGCFDTRVVVLFVARMLLDRLERASGKFSGRRFEYCMKDAYGVLAKDTCSRGTFMDRFNQLLMGNMVLDERVCEVFETQFRHAEDLSAGSVDGWVQNGAFMFKVLFFTSITSTVFDTPVVHPNLRPPDSKWVERILREDADILALKITLINNGIYIPEETRAAMKEDAVARGSKLDDPMRRGVNSSVDLRLKGIEFSHNGIEYHELPVNCAEDNFIASYSPVTFVVKDKPKTKGELKSESESKSDPKLGDEPMTEGGTKSGGKHSPHTYTLRYYGNPIRINGKELEVDYYSPCEAIKEMENSNIDRIAFVATDRIRYQHHDRCDYAASGNGCKFCELTAKGANTKMARYNEGDIMEAITETMARRHPYKEFNSESSTNMLYYDHVLIGGGTYLEHFDAKRRILSMCSRIQRLGGDDMPIYLMCVPPNTLTDLYEYKAAGVTEVAFNIEIYDQVLAAKFMPGKSRTTISKYLLTLTTAKSIWGGPGCVRSALILGLESPDSTMEAVRMLSSIGVSPILSIFRPVEGTDLEHVMPLPSEELYDLFMDSYNVCRAVDVDLGPSCIFCQNNTLTLPNELVEKEAEIAEREEGRRDVRGRLL